MPKSNTFNHDLLKKQNELSFLQGLYQKNNDLINKYKSEMSSNMWNDEFEKLDAKEQQLSSPWCE